MLKVIMTKARYLLDSLLSKFGYIRNNEYHRALLKFLSLDNDLSRIVTATFRGDKVVIEESSDTLTFKWAYGPKVYFSLLKEAENTFLKAMKSRGINTNDFCGETITEPLEYKTKKENK